MSESTEVATVPRNTYGPDPAPTAGGFRCSNGDLAVRMRSGAYEPPRGWRIRSVNTTSAYTYINIEKEDNR